MNTQTISENEKDALSQIDVSTPQEAPSFLGYKDLRLIFFFCFFALIFCLPKIYLTSQIYYLSRNIIKTENHLILLQEENRHLKKELEDFKFQQILNME